MRWFTRGVVDLGLLPSFLDENDPRSAKEQFDAKYIGGWRPMEGFKFDDVNLMIKYPGDPPLQVIAVTRLRDEMILLFPYSWVLVLQKGGNYEICRMD